MGRTYHGHKAAGNERVSSKMTTTSSQERLDEFNAKLKKKTEVAKPTRVYSTPSPKPLGSTLSNFELNVQQKREQNPAGKGTSNLNSIEPLNALSAHMNMKIDEGANLRKPSGNERITPEANSRERLDEFNAKIKKKMEEGVNASRVHKKPSSKLSGSSLSNSELKLQRKHENNADRKGTPKLNSAEPLDEYNAKIKKKMKEGASPSRTYRQTSLNSSQISASSFESKLQRRLESNAARKKRTPSPTVKLDQKTRVDEYNDKLKKKTEEGGSQSRVYKKSPQDSPGSSLSSFESKLEQKLAQQGKKTKKPEENSFLSSFDMKLQQKLSKKRGNKANKN